MSNKSRAYVREMVWLTIIVLGLSVIGVALAIALVAPFPALGAGG